MSWDRTLRRLNDLLFNEDGIKTEVKVETGYYFLYSGPKIGIVVCPLPKKPEKGESVYLSGFHVKRKQGEWIETCLEVSIPGLPVTRRLAKPRFARVWVDGKKTVYSEPLIHMRFPQAIDEFAKRALRFIYLNLDLD